MRFGPKNEEKSTEKGDNRVAVEMMQQIFGNTLSESTILDVLHSNSNRFEDSLQNLLDLNSGKNSTVSSPLVSSSRESHSIQREENDKKVENLDRKEETNVHLELREKREEERVVGDEDAISGKSALKLSKEEVVDSLKKGKEEMIYVPNELGLSEFLNRVEARMENLRESMKNSEEKQKTPSTTNFLSSPPVQIRRQKESDKNSGLSMNDILVENYPLDTRETKTENSDDELIMKKLKERDELERDDFVFGTSPSNPDFFNPPSPKDDRKNQSNAVENQKVQPPVFPGKHVVNYLSSPKLGDNYHYTLGPHRGIYDMLSYSSILPYLPNSLATPYIGPTSKWDLRNQASDLGRSIMEKGLTNQTGQNNCFLNVIIQSLWHLRAFRTKFIEHQKHIHYNQIGRTDVNGDDGNCPYCALKLTFTQYQFSENKEIPPDALRDAMSYISSGKFQIGSIEDAAELFDTLLLTIHQSMNGSFEEDKICSCLVHETFGMKMIEFVVCECGKKGRHVPYRQFIHYVPAQALRKISSEHLYETEEGLLAQGISLGSAIKRCNHSETQTCIDSDCRMKATRRTFISNAPQVLTIGIAWNTSEPTLDAIFDLLQLISPQLELKEMFDSCPDGGTYVFRGMVCYYGKHYNAYFKNRHTEEWIVFDDTTVKKVGREWMDVMIRCRDGKFQPLLVFYEKVEYKKGE